MAPLPTMALWSASPRARGAGGPAAPAGISGLSLVGLTSRGAAPDSDGGASGGLIGGALSKEELRSRIQSLSAQQAAESDSDTASLAASTARSRRQSTARSAASGAGDAVPETAADVGSVRDDDGSVASRRAVKGRWDPRASGVQPLSAAKLVDELVGPEDDVRTPSTCVGHAARTSPRCTHQPLCRVPRPLSVGGGGVGG